MLNVLSQCRKGTVLVNRGWVPGSWEGETTTLQRSCPGDVSVIGVVQPSERPSAAVPQNVPDQLEFHWFDVPSLVRQKQIRV